MDLKKYGPWALVIGGSEGVGESFARKLAAEGFKLVLVARRLAPLNALAEDLRAGGAEVRVLSVDMGRPEALAQTRAATDDIEVGLLVYNAGAARGMGAFLDKAADEHLALINLNCTNQAAFSHHYGNLMRGRGRGGIILVGSTGSFMGVPGLIGYSGVKAFSRVFTEGLWAECEDAGVDVLHLCLGFLATPGAIRAGADVSQAQTCDAAAQAGLDNIANGPIWIPENYLERVAKRSQLEGRGEAVRGNAIKVPGMK